MKYDITMPGPTVTLMLAISMLVGLLILLMLPVMLIHDGVKYKNPIPLIIGGLLLIFYAAIGYDCYKGYCT